MTHAGFADRFMFGSDQMVWPDDIGIAIDAVGPAPLLTEAQRRDITCRNATRFLRFAPQVCD